MTSPLGHVRASVVTLCTLVLIASGLTVGLVVAPTLPPEALSAAPTSWTAPTSAVSFTDERQVNVTPVLTPGVQLTTGETGRVTASTCSVGGTITSGTSPLTVDDRSIVALSTSRPLWRDMGPGLVGDDVRSLQDELARLGLATPLSGIYDQETQAAVHTLLASLGIASQDSSVIVASILWIPAPTVSVESCDLPLGSLVSAGDSVATTTGTLTALMVDPPTTTGLVEGDRALTYAGVTATLPATQTHSLPTVTDPALLSAVATGSDYTAWRLSGGQSPMTIGYELATPVDALAVPPGSLFALTGTSGCIRSGSLNHPVTVIASQLGQTLVRLEDGASPDVVDSAPHDAPSTC